MKVIPVEESTVVNYVLGEEITYSVRFSSRAAAELRCEVVNESEYMAETAVIVPDTNQLCHFPFLEVE